LKTNRLAYNFMDRLVKFYQKFQLSKERRKPVLIEKPLCTNILVLSPHKDDDVIGCGGVLSKHIRANDRITVVYMTDGRRGDNPYKISEDELVEAREKESMDALGILGGVESIHFLNYTEKELICGSKEVSAVKAILSGVKPELVYLPFFLDNHPDHAATVKIFFKAAEELEWKGICAFYEVWTALIPNTIIDISSLFEIKKNAIYAHKSQTKLLDYADKILGLNRYRTIYNSRIKGYAEAFYICEFMEISEWLKENDNNKKSNP